MSIISTLCRPTAAIDRGGFAHGHEGQPRLFDVGFDRRYDAAYAAGFAVRIFEKAAWVHDDGRPLKPGNGDLH